MRVRVITRDALGDLRKLGGSIDIRRAIEHISIVCLTSEEFFSTRKDLGVKAAVLCWAFVGGLAGKNKSLRGFTLKLVNAEGDESLRCEWEKIGEGNWTPKRRRGYPWWIIALALVCLLWQMGTFPAALHFDLSHHSHAQNRPAMPDTPRFDARAFAPYDALFSFPVPGQNDSVPAMTHRKVDPRCMASVEADHFEHNHTACAWGQGNSAGTTAGTMQPLFVAARWFSPPRKAAIGTAYKYV